MFDRFDAPVRALADALRARALHMAAAESCTGGLIAAACTSVAGSSDWFERGFVTYSNEAKTELLGVDPALIERDGAVSETVARAMAEGARKASRADLAVAVTGVAGPGGGTPTKPVGLVWIALAGPGERVIAERHDFAGDRAAVREQSAQRALQLLLEAAQRT
jgi:nicotinamide-nucleotide amidase